VKDEIAKNYETDLPFFVFVLVPIAIEDFIESTTAEEIADRLLEETNSSEFTAFSISISKNRLIDCECGLTFHLFVTQKDLIRNDHFNRFSVDFFRLFFSYIQNFF
jgi:hypothetical protein